MSEATCDTDNPREVSNFDWGLDPPSQLFVVAWKSDLADADSPTEWTLSPRQDALGWNTDCDCRGYGLPKAVAIEIARRYNAGGGK